MEYTHKIYSSVQRTSGAENKMANAASRLTHLTDKTFLRHFELTSPQRKTWRLFTLLSECKRRLTYMLHIKRCSMNSPPQSTRKTPPPGPNGANYASG